MYLQIYNIINLDENKNKKDSKRFTTTTIQNHDAH